MEKYRGKTYRLKKDGTVRETIRSRLATWWRNWIAKHVPLYGPNGDYTLDEINTRQPGGQE